MGGIKRTPPPKKNGDTPNPIVPTTDPTTQPPEVDPGNSTASGVANNPTDPTTTQDQTSSLSNQPTDSKTKRNRNVSSQIGLIIQGDRSLRSGDKASSAISKVEAARLMELQKQQQILQEQAEAEKALIEAEKEARIKQLEREAAERRLQEEKEAAEREARLQQLRVKSQLSKDQLNLSMRAQEILEQASRSSRRSNLVAESQSGSDKVKDWIKNSVNAVNMESTSHSEAANGAARPEEPRNSVERPKEPTNLSRQPEEPATRPNKPEVPKFGDIDNDLSSIKGIPVLNQRLAPAKKPEPTAKRTNTAKPAEAQDKEEDEEAEMRKFVEIVCAVVDRKEMHRSQQAHPSRLHNEAHQNSLYYGNDVKRDLPKFDGNPKDYKIFLNHYKDSEAHYTAAQNLSRIAKALPDKSPARMAVLDLLSLPENIPTILGRLELMFGQPEHLIAELRTKIEGMPQISEKNVEKIVDFSTVVTNLTTTLENTGEEASLRSPELLRLVVKKLPSNMQFDWTKTIAGKRNVSLKDFQEWLAPIADASLKLLDRSVYFSWKTPASKESQPKRLNVHAEASSASQESSQSEDCLFCKKAKHKMNTCKFFARLSYDKKWKAVKKIRVCFKCLEDRHRADECESKECGVDSCNANHHRLLHPKSEKKKPEKSSKESPKPTKEDPKPNCHVSGHDGILYKVLPVILYGPNKSLKIYAFIDEGSSVSVMDKSLATDLELEGVTRPLSLRWTDGSIQSERNSKCLTMQISGVGIGSRKHKIENIRTVSALDLPTQSLNLAELIRKNPQFNGLPIAEFSEVKPGLILGLDHYKLGIPLDIVEGEVHEPSACKSRLGWYVYGKHGLSVKEEHHMCHISMEEPEDENERLHQEVKSFFTTENFGVAPPAKDILCADDERAMKIFRDTIELVDGRYKCGLLWKFDELSLPDSLKMAEQRFQTLEKKFGRDPDYAKIYRGKMQEYFDKGYARYLTDEEIKAEVDRVWYLPHFGVQHQNKPSKLRIVFDAAASVGKTSLNSFLLTGPDVYASLLGILWRFRERPFAVAGDIREMFNRIVIRPEDQNVQRFLWRPNEGDPVKHALFVSLFFGARCAPAIAQLVKNENARKYQPTLDHAVREIVENHYVDDFLGSFNSEEEALEVSQQVKYIHSQGGFEIRNFISNSRMVAHKLNGRDDLQVDLSLNLDNEGLVDRVLGMYWNLQKDVFVFKLNESRVPKKVLEGARKLTKREYLRVVMSLFDPMGILGHLVVQAKIIIQNVWKSGIGWDEQLHDREFDEWKIWWELVHHINSIEIPRHYGLLQDVTNVQLHLFMDASDKAFSVVAYWRLESSVDVKVALIGSKTKVAPIKLLSIPRLELQGALLAKRFADTIQKEHSIKPDQRFFWCDSKTVHCWLKSRGKDFKLFVALRVGEILDGTEANEWRYVPSKENVADVATKANKELEVNNNQRWFKGPDFLRKGQDHWPKESPAEADEAILEVKSIHHISVEDRGFSLIDESRFSSWNRLLRTTARVLKVSQLPSERPFTVAKFVAKLSENLTLNDVAKAKEFLIKKAQWEAFPNDIKNLEEKKPIPNNSQLKTLSPYLENGILRIKGRIDALHCGRDLKRPIILPRKHKITFLIIDNLHKLFKHQLSEAVVNEIRQEFWVPRLRVEVNHVKGKCQECKNQKAKATVVEMSPLPNVRLNPFFRPFTSTGLDYFGPLEVVIGRRREKRWVALFTCLTVRAIHMELVYSLSADSCILALRSFINRRGCPKDLLSDNATCFKGASRELKEAIADMDQSCLQEECTMKGISWQMIPPYSPHKGGAWERMVRSVKSVIGKVLYERALREETLRSFLTEAEQIINSRPLTYVPLDSEADPALTPNDFLLQSSNGLKEKWDFPEKLLRKQWKISQELADHFWNRWVREYAPTILKRSKWFEDERPLAVGDVVVVLDEKTARNNWVRGRVVEVVPSKDGKIRTVKIRTENGIRVRSVSNLARLDLNSDSE